jgi:hypothetical protein
MGMSDRGRRILFVGVGLVGYALLARVLLVEGIQGAGGLGGIDAIAYWTAAGHAWRNEPLYAVGGFGFGAYQYPPLFAQVLAPASLLPMSLFVWLWRLLELIGLRLATGGWARSGIAILIFPPVIAEIDAGNVHLIMAGVAGLAMRGVAAPVGPALLVKFSTWPLAPVGWTRDRRGLFIGAVGIALAALVSIVLSAANWTDYLAFLSLHAQPAPGYKFLDSVPYLIRLAAAGIVGLAAIRWLRLAPIAVLLAYPVVWFHALSTLTAIVAPTSRTHQVGSDAQASGEWPQ